ncbi:uncharacterized protein Z518_10771 [Rhinocladiella mackenziei CBS 650.93]|uniref:Rhinocladiella mackenziei CBS 650.93 unplaced genomic scaffold supercont1.10, whole genome shotgun sequence n=1 Tax=Rhinocladiella mackenziei CBS 650.93 TaxID=1442369 RepID=A0A0D2I262_9EURO|nr:uncharacterized protein Z518_10771 [Rhinocladiella mackenziei CBS 650.93]KIW99843.1 hypothetical protein Z518_10771 [Rhinocladiella mackenziei CBS 650.93]
MTGMKLKPFNPYTYGDLFAKAITDLIQASDGRTTHTSPSCPTGIPHPPKHVSFGSSTTTNIGLPSVFETNGEGKQTQQERPSSEWLLNELGAHQSIAGNSTSSQTTKVEIPNFDPKAYGDPTADTSTNSPSTTSNTGRPKYRGSRGDTRESGASTNAASSKVNSHAIKPSNGDKTSLLAQGTHEPTVTMNGKGSRIAGISPQAANAGQQKNTSAVMIDTSEQNRLSDVTEAYVTKETHQNEPSKENGKRPPAVTYETLKKDDETPQQVMVRLQAAGVRQVRDIRRQMGRKSKHEPTTTALNTLDALRREPSPNPDRSTRLGFTLTSVAPRTLSERNPTLHLTESLRDGGLRNDNNMSEPVRGKQSVIPNPIRPKPVQDSNHARNTAVSTLDHQNTFHTDKQSDMKRRSRWATAKELKVPVCKPDSNAEGSDAPESDADSVRPMVSEFGRLIRSRQPAVPESQLWAWDGGLQPPPLDWEHRPQFYNNHPEYINGFERWLGANTVRTMSGVATSTLQSTEQRDVPNIDFAPLSSELLQDPNNHPDGIGFTPRETVLNSSNAERYGVNLNSVSSSRRGSIDTPLDFEAEAKLDLSRPENSWYKDETAQKFVDKRMRDLERNIKEAEVQRAMLQQQMQAPTNHDTVVNGQSSEARGVKYNVYLRPAVRADHGDMAKIYNWHIKNGVRPSELNEITEEEMRVRHDMSESARLPVIVAVVRNRKSSRVKAPAQRVHPTHPIQNIDPSYNGVVKDEQIVGWASATDWTASDYVETTTAELELYVAPDFRQKGVGRCLLDALLDATDRGYMKKGGYDFHVAPELKHMYTTGGGRDLHKIIFQIRSFNKPITPEQDYRYKRDTAMRANWGYVNGYNNTDIPPPAEEVDFSKDAKINDREDDYSVWLKEWLESYGFEEEATLKKLGTKKRRYVDLYFLSRYTCWQPAENKIPDFSGGI